MGREGIVYQDAKGRWVAVVELPRRDGKRRRKVVRAATQVAAKRELRKLLNAKDVTGDLETRSLTVSQWMDEWMRTIAVHKIRPKTANTYKGLIAREIIPRLGHLTLDKLTPTDVRHMNQAILDKGLSSATAGQVHRILVVALGYAVSEGHATRNVAQLVDAPKPAKKVMPALGVSEAITVLRASTTDSYGSLWAAVLLTGARQGELLGLEVDRVTERIDVAWQLQRLPWEHGCGGTCGRARGTDCKQRKITTPSDWEGRHLTGGLWLARPKTNKGWRVIPLVDPLKSIIATHLKEREGTPNPYGLVWTMPDGSPIDPRVQYGWWLELLERAGVPKVRLHDGRHTTVDLLYEAGVPEDLIREIVGHSSREVTRGYKARGNNVRLTAAMEQLSAMFTPSDDGHSDTHALGA